MDQGGNDMTQRDDMAYKLGALSAEVRILKWVGAIAITANFAFFSFFAQQVNALQAGQLKIIERLTRVEQRLDAVESRLDAVESRLDAVESRLGSFEQRIASNELQIKSHSHL